ncbi:MAG: hypothetical protein HUK20_03220 [Fibrobacter sp.]|nr:hypothetical protein [Fibrobacter sp.]
MKKLFAFVSIMAVLAFAQDNESDDVAYGEYEAVASQVDQHQGSDDDPLPAPKRPTYNFASWGLGLSIWHNWEDSEMNPKRDWDQAVLLRHARIWEMTTHGAITLVDNLNIAFNDEFEMHDVITIGGRFFFADQVFSPFLGGGFGIGIQYDGHFDDWSEYFGVGFGFNVEAGVVIFRTSTTQLEIGTSYDFMFDGFNADRMFGAFNFYVAINY